LIKTLFTNKPNEWDKVRAELKIKFAWARITQCELNYPNCWKDQALGFAHAKKRRHLLPGELEVVILACNPCHDIIEKLPESEMAEIVYQVIKSRKTQP